MSDAAAATNLPLEGPGGAGAALLKERRRQGLSIGDVSRQLKLSVRQIEALERDDYSAYKGPVFVHGFIRNYAKLLGLDPEPLIRATDAMLDPQVAHAVPEPARPARAPGSPRQQPQRWPAVAALALIAVALLAYFAGRPRPDARHSAAPMARSESTAPAAPPTAESGTKETKAPADAAAKKAPVKPAARQETRNAPSSDQVAAGAAAQTDTPGAADPAGAGRIKVRMIFDEECWVEIKDRSGNTVFGQLNPAGSRRSVSAEPPLEVVVGHAAGVRMFVDDKPVDLAPHTRVDVAHLTLE